MTRVMSLSSLGGTLTLDGSTGVQAKLALRGTGLPPVSGEWFEGAGDGATFRGGRNLARVLDLPIKVYASDRSGVREKLSQIGRIFDLRAGDVRLQVALDTDEWFIDVRRTGGGDWSWDVDTDGLTFVKTIITVQAGDPFWTRRREESRLLEPGGLGLGLLGPGVSLAQLQQSSGSGFGSVSFINSGDVPAFGVWTIRAPFSSFTLESPSGEQLVWGTGGDGEIGATKTEGFIVVNMELGTVVDELGVNQYGGLGPVPRFWAVEPGSSTAQISATDATGGETRVEVVWRAKRWVMF